MARLTFQRASMATRPAPCRAAPLQVGVRVELRAANDDAAFATGWFDSTWDLWSGLDVHEDAPFARGWPVARERPGRAAAGLAFAA